MAGHAPLRSSPVANALFAHPFLLSLALIGFAVLAIGPNFTLACLSAFVLVVGIALLWRPGESPILLFLFGYQWMQGSILIFLSNLRGLDISAVWDATGEVGIATMLTEVGLLVFALGMRIGAGGRRLEQGREAWSQALSRPLDTWFWIYFATAFVGAGAEISARFLPGLSQPLLTLALIKWAFFFMLAYAAVASRQLRHPLFLTAFAFELLRGLGGYFSDFKTVFLITILAAVATNRRVSPRTSAAMGVIVSAMLMLAVVWTAVKQEYRGYVSGGETAQVVKVDYVTRVTKLRDLILGLDAEQLEIGAENLVHRVSYVTFFGDVLDYVPEFIPHENGKIYADALVRPFMPRLFFPNKAIIDDSARTNEYTGLNVAGASDGVSISLGWMAESYIDFGRYFMFGGIFGIGLIYGLINNLFAGKRASSPLLGDAMATAVLFSAAALESSLTKVLGGVAVTLLMALLFVRFAVPYWQPWLLNKRPRNVAAGVPGATAG